MHFNTQNPLFPYIPISLGECGILPWKLFLPQKVA